jgi:hypothetical protein
MAETIDPNKARPKRLLIAHILCWVGLAAASYATAGSHTIASCWWVILFYIPYAIIFLQGLAGVLLIVLLASIAWPASRKGLSFSVVCHSAILMAGANGCILMAAAATSGVVNCL